MQQVEILSFFLFFKLIHLLNDFEFLQLFWRVVGSRGTLQIDRGNQDGKHGYLVFR